MTIDEILTKHGITDPDTVAAIKADMPGSFMPLADANKRIAAAKKAADDATEAFEAYKADQAKAADEAAKASQGKTDELEALKKQHEELQQRFEDAQTKARQATGREALVRALKDGGANPAAVELLASSALQRIEYSEDGKPGNVDEIAKSLQESNAGLFGVKIESGQQQQPATNPNEPEDRFLKGFGKL